MSDIKKALIACLNDLEAINEGGQYGRTVDLVLSALSEIEDQERGQDIKQFMQEHFQLINIGGK